MAPREERKFPSGPEEMDWSVVNELKEVMGVDFPRTLGEFLADSQQRLEALDRAITAGETGEARRLSHQLKGIGASFGGRTFSCWCGELQHAAEAGRLERAPELLEKTRQAFSHLTMVLKERYGGHD